MVMWKGEILNQWVELEEHEEIIQTGVLNKIIVGKKSSFLFLT